MSDSLTYKVQTAICKLAGVQCHVLISRHILAYPSVRYLSALGSCDSPTKVPAGGGLLVWGGAVGACRSANELPPSASCDPSKPPSNSELLTRVDLFE